MKYLPTIYKSKFKKDKILIMNPIEYLPRCGGTYIERGTFKSFYKFEKDYEEVIFEEGTIMIPGFYKPPTSSIFIEMPKDHYIKSCQYGWNLISLEDDSILRCIFYPSNDKPYSIPVNSTLIPGEKIKNWDTFINRISHDQSLTLCNAICINEEKEIFFPKNFYLVVVNGNVLINGNEKVKKKWIKSTKNQQINIKNNQENNSLIFLLE